MSPVERLDHGFAVAKDQLAIERLLDPEGTYALNTHFSLCQQNSGQLYLFRQELR